MVLCGFFHRMLENFVAPFNATPCERLKNAGAILIGKTNLDEFAMGSGAVDSIFGPTRNVWKANDSHDDDWNIAGGSSGGSAVAVASGLCYGYPHQITSDYLGLIQFPFLLNSALGSDTGGSVRNPASYCGVIGLKPTYGLISRYGLIPLVNSMDVPGIFTRSVDDCVAMLNAVAGPDPMDSTTIKLPHSKIALSPAEQISLEHIKIGIPKEYHCEGLAADVLETWVKIADMLEDAGAQVKQVSLPHTASSIFVYSILNQCDVTSNMSRYDGVEYGYRAGECEGTDELYARTRAIGFNSVVKNRILSGNYFLLERNYDKYFKKALQVRRLISDDFDRVFGGMDGAERVDVLLTPTTLTDAPVYSEFVQASNRDQCAVQDFCTQPANMAGIPALSIPIRLSAKGLPLSLQLMGPKLSETLILAIAKWIESQVNFEHHHCGQ